MSKIYAPDSKSDEVRLWEFERKCEGHYYFTYSNIFNSPFITGRLEIENYLIKFTTQKMIERIEIFLLSRNRSGFIKSEQVALVKDFNGIIPFSNLEELQNFLLIL